jgi:protein gp37
MKESGIDWTRYSWNPVTGCFHDCGYCYARGFAKRFCGDIRLNKTRTENYAAENGLYTVREPIRGRGGEVLTFPFGFAPTYHANRFGKNAKPLKIKEPSAFFVGAFTDLFGDWVPGAWIRDVFAVCAAAPQHAYLFLTKNPKRYLELAKRELLPQEHWYGYTITNRADANRHSASSYEWDAVKNLFISLEPLLEEIPYISTHTPFDWLIAGALTGPGAEKRRPKKEWVADIVGQCRARGIPVFMKSSLADVWGADLIREYPAALRVMSLASKPKTGEVLTDCR